MLYDAEANTYLMGWRDFDPTTGRFIVPDTYEGEDDEPTTLNRYLYAEGDPVNNIDPDGNFGKWLQAAWKVTKKAYNFAIGDDIQTLTSPKTKWYQKLGAAAMIASNFVPGLGQAKWAIKGAKAGLKASKAVKTIRYARSLKVTKKIKVAAKSVKKQPLRMNLQYFGGKGKVHGHHSDPKYLGGNPKQKLTKLDEQDHIAIHKEIDKKYPRRKGKSYYDNLRGIDPEFDSDAKKFLSNLYGSYKNKYPNLPRDYNNNYKRRDKK